MNLRINWDALGVSASVACAIHCAVLPLIATSLPVFGVDIIDNVAFEYGMIFLAFAIGSWSMWHGFKKPIIASCPCLFSVGHSFSITKNRFGTSTSFGFACGSGTDYYCARNELQGLPCA